MYNILCCRYFRHCLKDSPATLNTATNLYSKIFKAYDTRFLKKGPKDLFSHTIYCYYVHLNMNSSLQKHLKLVQYFPVSDLLEPLQYSRYMLYIPPAFTVSTYIQAASAVPLLSASQADPFFRIHLDVTDWFARLTASRLSQLPWQSPRLCLITRVSPLSLPLPYENTSKRNHRLPPRPHPREKSASFSAKLQTDCKLAC